MTAEQPVSESPSNEPGDTDAVHLAYKVDIVVIGAGQAGLPPPIT